MKTWILIANAAEARLFEAAAEDGPLVERAGFRSPESRLHGIEFTRDRAFRVQESATPARHGIEPRQDPHDKVSVDFARELAAVLQHGRNEHDYQRLVLVAPPRFLGQLRQALDTQVARRVVDSRDKDLVNASPAEIEALLRA